MTSISRSLSARGGSAKGQKESAFLSRLHNQSKPVLVFDGATGTSLQQLELKAEDFGGQELEGCNENLVRTKPDAVRSVHKLFLEAGCDVIETNTFGASSVVLAEYGLEKDAFELNKKATQIAKSISSEYSSINKPRFVAGSIGPTTKLPTLGHIKFDDLKASYQEQAEGLIAGEVDLFIVETCQDVLQVKAALQGINQASLNNKTYIPIMVSVTMETTGTMLLGTDISAVLAILEPFPIDILGLNCATGPEQMKEHIAYLSRHCPFVISCIPNAGLPENIGGVAHYRLTPIEMKMQLMHFIQDLNVRVIGGCCGTTPDHIASLSALAEELSTPDYNKSVLNSNLNVKVLSEPSAASIYSTTPYKQDNSFLIIGERLNASGSRKVRDLLNQEDWDGLVNIARGQVKENAHILDVNVDYVGRDGVKDMSELVSRLVKNIDLPLMLDSTEWEKMESGLKVSGGKSILNSTNYEDGEERFNKVLQLAKHYGSAIVVGTIDEEGMARTAERKLEIAKRAYNDATSFGIPPSEIFYDPLALPISTGIEEDRRNGIETIKAIRQITSSLSGVHILLGISNISFGLSPAARITLNSVFLQYCIEAGLDSAIVSPSKILPLSKITDKHQKICRDLINDNRQFDKELCIYDPLTELTSAFAGVTSTDARGSTDLLDNLPLEKKLSRYIIDGERIGLNSLLDEALDKYKPLDIVNSFLLDGMKTVGELFGSGQMQLPFVLQSAETMKSAVAYLEPFMDKDDTKKSSKGKFLIATVKGDVHDIGKNLVDIILTNNGYEVINLGIKQDVTKIIESQIKYKADCIAMSGLLVKSTAFMKDNLRAFNEAGIEVPVILGGAALTPRFVNRDCSEVYNGKVIYGKDAFTDLRFMEAYMSAKNNGEWNNRIGFLCDTPDGISLPENESQDSNNLKGSSDSKSDKKLIDESKSYIETERSLKVFQEETIEPPFVGPRILKQNDIPIEEVFFYLDKNALFSSQWQIRKLKNQTKTEYQEHLSKVAQPILDKWTYRIKEENLLEPSATYGYFPCGRLGNSLQIFSPSTNCCLGDFQLPRQKYGSKYCIADFFNDLKDGKPTDYVPMQAVTMGEKASIFSQELFNNDSYSDYLFFHGLSVQLTEALAEWLHSKIRIECGYKSSEPKSLRDILAQRYQGCRYSFGYPACPNVSDSKKQLEWLDASRIGLSMDASDQLQPEQSTTAIVSLHSQAKYFSA